MELDAHGILALLADDVPWVRGMRPGEAMSLPHFADFEVDDVHVVDRARFKCAIQFNDVANHVITVKGPYDVRKLDPSVIERAQRAITAPFN